MLPVVQPADDRAGAWSTWPGTASTAAVLALGYRPDAFQAAYPDGRCAGVELHYAIEPEPRDTAGAIRFAALDAGHRTSASWCSTATSSPTSTSGRWWPPTSAPGAEGTIALHRVEDPSAFGVVPTDADGRVTAFIEKPPRDEAPTDLINAGTYVLEPSVLDRIAPDVPVNVERVTFPAMVADGSLYAVDGDTYWIDAGTPATYLAANLDLLNGRRPRVEAGRAPGRRGRRRRRRSRWSARARTSATAPSCRGSVVLAGAVDRRRAPSCGMPSSAPGPGSATGAVLDGGTVVGDDVVVAGRRRSCTGVRIPEEG